MGQLGGMEIWVLGAVFIAVVAAVVGLSGLVRRKSARKKKSVKKSSAPSGNTLVNRGKLSPALQILEPIQRRLTQSDPEQVGQTRRALIEAGYYESQAVDVFFSARLILAIGLAVAASVLLFVFPSPLSGSRGVLSVLATAAFGYYAPVFWLRLRIGARRKAFTLGMPDALDMILVGVQAGLSLPAALRHVVEEFGSVHPVVAEQFLLVSLEFQAGMSRTEALDRMAARMRVPEAKTFATMMAQAESLGTRMSDTLMVIADEMRTDRELRAEQKAAELPVRMSIPLVLLVFPCLFLVIMSPVVINIVRTFAQIGR